MDHRHLRLRMKNNIFSQWSTRWKKNERKLMERYVIDKSIYLVYVFVDELCFLSYILVGRKEIGVIFKSIRKKIIIFPLLLVLNGNHHDVDVESIDSSCLFSSKNCWVVNDEMLECQYQHRMKNRSSSNLTWNDMTTLVNMSLMNKNINDSLLVKKASRLIDGKWKHVFSLTKILFDKNLELIRLKHHNIRFRTFFQSWHSIWNNNLVI